jgi:MarR family transcriptional regulator, organic hydroperoxide resistance regulator
MSAGEPSAEPSVEDDRRDLAAMVVPLGRALTAGERPILDARGLTMWAYVVLVTLADEPVRTQAALAEAIGADKTRIIPVLDDLQQRGLIKRTPDPSDRRGHLLSVTPDGSTLFRAVQSGIRTYEHQLLNRLLPDERRGLLRALARLSSLSWRELTSPDAASSGAASPNV